jgi:hypothetical protein
METVLEAIDRLRALGFGLDFTAVAGGRVHCEGCGKDFAAGALTVDETVRFEGASDPEDETILLALSSPDGCRGLFTAAFGAATTSDDADVLHALVRD